ncbi:hypothetical protein [Flavobacterium pectinovorum]|uniref:hypothetical protein n=1 Tax=Flavobacterium pectinovorum TaxID=29533 RepID=UPI001FAC5DBD|nr:hypothetical protein [Flavobacterium pectinovorum]MCI9844363.1 hypothetical protein [Flavobacterium pectinovorum]
MKIIDNKQIWKGFFTYLHGYEIIDTYVRVAFQMDLTFDGNSFTGTSTDSESENIFTEPIMVKGFIENDIISFVINYPYHYYKDEDGNIKLDKNAQHPTIEYFGYYEKSEKKYSGTWEMIIFEEKISKDEYIEEVANGEFEIYRDK